MQLLVMGIGFLKSLLVVVHPPPLVLLVACRHGTSLTWSSSPSSPHIQLAGARILLYHFNYKQSRLLSPMLLASNTSPH